MGISSRRMQYAWGSGGTRSSVALTEGAPVIRAAHVPTKKVAVGTSAPLVTRAEPGILVDNFQIGGIYYTVTPRLIWSPSWVKVALDTFFENNTPGGSPNYARTYYASEVAANPTEWMSWAKWTAKAGHDVHEVLHGGIVKGFTIEQRAQQMATISLELAFPFFDPQGTDLAADAAAWALVTSGNVDPWPSASTTGYWGIPGGALTTLAFDYWRLTVSYAIAPSFYSGQDADRISRGKYKATAEIIVRDTDGDEVEDLDASLMGGVALTFAFIDLVTTDSSVGFNGKLHAGGGQEGAVTRRGHYNLTVADPDITNYEWDYKIYVVPARA